MSNSTCKHCGKFDFEHHAFVPATRPSSTCVCDPETWEPNPIGPVCEKLEKDSPTKTRCGRCEHDQGCHETPKSGL